MSPLPKWTLVACLCLPMALQAQTAPFIRLTAGQLFTNPGHNQTITFSPAYWKTDSADRNWTSALYGGLSAGMRVPVTTRLEAEAGIGIYQAENITQSGRVLQYSTPDFYNMNYTYQIRHQSFMLEGKLLTSVANIYHPYLSAGIGISRNRSDGYQELTFQPYAVPDPSFQAATESSPSYALGLGVDIDAAPHLRVGAGYQYRDLGTAKLGTAPTEQTSQKLSAGHLKASELMLQMTYSR